MSKLVAEKLGLKIIEASEDVIFPIADLGRFSKEEELISYLSARSGAVEKNISREKARELFSELQKRYGSDFIAKALHAKYVKTPQNESYVFSGLRGLDNAKYCRMHNDLVIYLRSDRATLAERLQRDRQLTKEEAVKELEDEEMRFRTREIEQVADLVIDVVRDEIEVAVSKILEKVEEWDRMCKRCVNVARNPAIKFNEDGYCHICEAYLKHFDPEQLKKELAVLEGFKKGTVYNVMVGISGGKDSTATLHRIKKMGFHPLAFTFDTGYLPETTIQRAKDIARKLDIDYEVIDIRSYIRDIDVAAYEKLADLYEKPFKLETKKAFRDFYASGRKHYSVKCPHAPTFVRTCQICRRVVIRAYYQEASARGIQAIVLGMNEWTNLSASQGNDLQKVSGMRTLQPFQDKPAVSVFHLPFLLQLTIHDVEKDLAELNWQPPEGEDLIESNSNSCLLARSTERMAKRLLEFHPDSTRLAREVTAGFLSKDQALAALRKIHPYKYTAREVLQRAGILGK